MKNLQLHIDVRQCAMEELTEEDRELVEKAIEVTCNSYAPYSNFHVGAAVRLRDGSVITGANQENAAFPSGLCAERSALFAAQSQRPDQPVMALAIAARNSEGLVAQPISPCGACRQVILGIEDRYKQPVRVMLYGTEGVYILNSAADLLPFSFVDSCMH